MWIDKSALGDILVVVLIALLMTCIIFLFISGNMFFLLGWLAMAVVITAIMWWHEKEVVDQDQFKHFDWVLIFFPVSFFSFITVLPMSVVLVLVRLIPWG